MTTVNHAAVCNHPGCTAAPFVDTRGRHYKKCRNHLGEGFAAGAQKRQQAKKSALGRKGEQVKVLILDWKNERMLWITGTADCVEPLPGTEADLLDILARAAQDGIYVAKPHAFRLTDLKPEVPERKKKGKTHESN